jgi:18S rRNA (guanine1575-N7)-methyltransferase
VLGHTQLPASLISSSVIRVADLSYLGSSEQIPRGLEADDEIEGDEVRFERRRERERRRTENGGKRKGVKVKDKAWILKKKEVRCKLRYDRSVILTLLDSLQLYRQRGKEDVPRDSKFTGRKRRTVF